MVGVRHRVCRRAPCRLISNLALRPRPNRPPLALRADLQAQQALRSAVAGTPCARDARRAPLAHACQPVLVDLLPKLSQAEGEDGERVLQPQVLRADVAALCQPVRVGQTSILLGILLDRSKETSLVTHRTTPKGVSPSREIQLVEPQQ